MDTFGFKDFESVRLKATYNIEIGGRTIEEGETIAYFDTIQIAGLQENFQVITAHGGFEDRDRVFWERAKDTQISFSKGVFNKEQFALLTNSRMLQVAPDKVVCVSMRETLESNENGQITLKFAPALSSRHKVFVYDKLTGQKLQFECEENIITISEPYKDVIVDYQYDYNGGGSVVMIGQHLINGFLRLEGKTRLKDDTTGQVVTGLIVIPRLKLMSNLSMRLGAQANPVVGNFSALGVPVGDRGTAHVSEFYFLNDYLESDL